jgi:hypothetical protein
MATIGFHCPREQFSAHQLRLAKRAEGYLSPFSGRDSVTIALL